MDTYDELLKHWFISIELWGATHFGKWCEFLFIFLILCCCRLGSLNDRLILVHKKGFCEWLTPSWICESRLHRAISVHSQLSVNVDNDESKIHHWSNNSQAIMFPDVVGTVTTAELSVLAFYHYAWHALIVNSLITYSRWQRCAAITPTYLTGMICSQKPTATHFNNPTT